MQLLGPFLIPRLKKKKNSQKAFHISQENETLIVQEMELVSPSSKGMETFLSPQKNFLNFLAPILYCW